LMLWRLAEAASMNKAGMLQAARNISHCLHCNKTV
jgi:hypothetical protein